MKIIENLIDVQYLVVVAKTHWQHKQNDSIFNIIQNKYYPCIKNNNVYSVVIDDNGAKKDWLSFDTNKEFDDLFEIL